MTLQKLADELNDRGIRTKTGKVWTAPNIRHLVHQPKPPEAKPVSKAQAARERRSTTKVGVRRSNDATLKWVEIEHPSLSDWRELAVQWLSEKETGLGEAIRSISAFMDFLAKKRLPTSPSAFLLYQTKVPDFYTSIWETSVLTERSSRTTTCTTLFNGCWHSRSSAPRMTRAISGLHRRFATQFLISPGAGYRNTSRVFEEPCLGAISKNCEK